MTNLQKKMIVFSGKQFSGKDTIAKILLKHFKTFTRIGIADAIKMKYSEQTGISLEKIEENKSKYRQGLIELGNWGRAKDADYWLKAIIAYKGDVIITDVRMRHELDVFTSYGAYTVRVEASEEVRKKRGELISSGDATETELDSVQSWNYVISNEGSYEVLEKDAENLIKAIEEYYK